MTYKSLNESLNHWAIAEVLGHYVSYESMFQVYAVCTSYPQKLLGSEKNFGKDVKKVKPGVYKISSPLVGSIIILVLSQMAQQEQNALWQLLKGIPSDERLKGVPLNERLKGLAPSEIEAYLLKLKKDSR